MPTLDEPLETTAARAVTGDRAALEDVCRALQGPIYRLAQRMLGQPRDAEDATQEILVQVVTHLAQFRGDSKLTTWAYTIATRHLLRARASRAEERAVSVEELAAIIDAGVAATHAGALPAGDVKVLARDVQRTCTQAMLFTLSRDERVALILSELGASDAVAAGLCEVREDAYRQRLSRARARLRPVLEERCGLVDPSRPCTCARGAAAKQRAGPRLPVYDDGVDAANQDMGELCRLRGVLAVEPPPAPRRELWAAVVERYPSLLGQEEPS